MICLSDGLFPLKAVKKAMAQGLQIGAHRFSNPDLGGAYGLK